MEHIEPWRIFVGLAALAFFLWRAWVFWVKVFPTLTQAEKEEINTLEREW